MIQYTSEEKAKAKAAKKAFLQNHKQEQKERRIEDELWAIRKQQFAERKSSMILTGILPSERLMSNNEPVYADYIYVIDHEGGKVIRSNTYMGTVKDLKYNLAKDGYKFKNVYTCDLAQRNLLF